MITRIMIQAVTQPAMATIDNWPAAAPDRLLDRAEAVLYYTESEQGESIAHLVSLTEEPIMDVVFLSGAREDILTILEHVRNLERRVLELEADLALTRGWLAVERGEPS